MLICNTKTSKITLIQKKIYSKWFYHVEHTTSESPITSANQYPVPNNKKDTLKKRTLGEFPLMTVSTPFSSVFVYTLKSKSLPQIRYNILKLVIIQPINM